MYFKLFIASRANYSFYSGATKIYKNPRAISTSTHQSIEIKPHASLVFWPGPIALFRDAHFSQITHISMMEESSSLCAIDWYSSGRLGRERWDLKAYSSIFSISRGGIPIINQHTNLHANDPSLIPIPSRMHHLNVLCTVYLIGPKFKSVIDNLLSYAAERGPEWPVQPGKPPRSLLYAINPVQPLTSSDAPVYVVRVGALCVDEVASFLRQALDGLHTIVGHNLWCY